MHWQKCRNYWRSDRVKVTLFAFFAMLEILILFNFVMSPQNEIQYNCEQNLTLTPLTDEGLDLKETKMFFLETSGRSVLNPRQACAVESAARNSKLDRIIVMIKSSELDLTDTVMCRLVSEFGGKKVSFHQVSPAQDFSNTPLESLYRDGAFKNSKYPSTHLSDALRMTYIYKFGGWYADVDYIILRQLNDLQDKVASVGADNQEENLWLTNSVLNIAKPRHSLPQLYLQRVSEHFKGEARTEIGPMFLTETFRIFCNLTSDVQLGSIVDTKEHDCGGLTVLQPDVFNPVRPGMDKVLLWRENPVDQSVWEQLFAKSKGIHFFSSSSNKLPVNDKALHAYAYLGPRVCPTSFHFSDSFHGTYVY